MSPAVAWEGAKYPPRRWQAEALPAVRDSLRAGERPVVSATMGAGKSGLLTELVRLMLDRASEREVIVIAAPTQALVRQLSKTVVERLGVFEVGVFYGRKKQPDRRVIVTCYPSVASLVESLKGLGKTVRLLVADECHQTEGEKVKAALQALEPRWAVGFSATPYRSSEDESLELWTSVAYSYGLRQALEDRVLVPWTTVRSDADTVSHAVGELLDTDELCCRLIAAHAEGPGIVSAASIADATDYAEVLTKAGVKAEPIHSRQSTKVRDRLLSQLRRGELDALVHVSLLAEGVDMPWLRWLCMRRKVGARVRFAQEMGRVLRSDPDLPDKRAMIIDPHDLLAKWGLGQPPAIGPTADDVGDVDLLAPAALGPRLPSAPKEIEIPPVVALQAADSWCRDLRMALDLAGLCADRLPGYWRSRASSDKQIRALGKMSWSFRYLPEEQRATAKRLSKSAHRLQAGSVSDLIDVCAALADASKSARSRRAHYKLPSQATEALPEGLNKAVTSAVRQSS